MIVLQYRPGKPGGDIRKQGAPVIVASAPFTPSTEKRPAKRGRPPKGK